MKIELYDQGIELTFGSWPRVQVHAGIALLAVAITFPLWASYSPARMAAAGIVMIGSVLSLLAHEMGHAWAAKRLGHRPTLIRLHAGGGEALWETRRHSRRDDVLITLAGPLANLVIGMICFAIYYLILSTSGSNVTESDGPWFRQPPLAPSAIMTALRWLGTINLVWTAANLLPAFPLDGGKLFQHMIEIPYGPHRALFWTGLIGLVLAIISTLALLIGALFGLVIWMPPSFAPNYRAVMASRHKRPTAVR